MSDRERETLDLRNASGEDRWSLFVAGDVYLSREDASGPILGPETTERVRSADVSVANFEAPLAPPGASPIPKSGPALENHPDAAERLAESGFDAVTLAHNHVMDYGPDGLDATFDAAAEAGLETVGVGEDHAAALEPLRLTTDGGTDVAILNVAEREFNVADDGPGAAWSEHRDVNRQVAAAADEADAVVVVAHGGVEYVPFPAPERQERLREFVDVGADVVVGHHPHVAQGWERYDDGVVFHSLGNFLFDSQTDSEPTSWGLAVDIAFEDGDPVTADLVPTEVVDDTVRPLGTTRDRADRMAFLRRLSEITADADEMRGYWQEVAIETFYRRYSNWLLMGAGGDFARARAEPNDPNAQRPLWDLETRRREILALLNIIRMESHRWVMTEALGVLSGDVRDRRTPDVSEEARELLDRTSR